MRTPSFGCLTSAPSVLENHLGIPDTHPELVEARRLFREEGKRSLILISDASGDGDLSVMRLSGHTHAAFLKSPAYEDVVLRLTRNSVHPITERGTFTMALYNLLSRHTLQVQAQSGCSVRGVFHNSCFELLFAYTPGTHCIAATMLRSLDQVDMQVRYCKISQSV